MKKLFLFLGFYCSLFITYAQNVGIGTGTPNTSAQLDITSTSKGLLIPRMTTAQRTAIASPANGLMVYDTNLAAFYFYNGSSWNALNSGGGGAGGWTASGNNIFNSNAGNVGIGSATGIKEKLSVKGNLFVTHTNGNDLVNGGNRAVVNLHGANTGTGVVNFLKPDTSTGASIYYGNILSQFVLQNGSNSYQVFLRSNGDVGIGTNNPLQKLDVNGNIRSRRNLFIDSSVTVKGRIDADGVVEAHGLSSIGALYVSSTSLLQGNVTGNGAATFGGLITSNTGVTINDAAGTLTYKTGGDDKAFVQLSGDDLRLGTFSPNTNGRFIVRSAGTNHLVVKSDGKTGIGVEDADAKLHINSGSSIEALRIQGNSNSIIRFMTGGTEKAYIYSVGNDLNISTVQPGGLMRLNNEVYIDNSLNRVGIGTVSPEQKLHVLGNAIVTGAFRVGNTAVPAGYKFAVEGKAICEELKVQLRGAWPDYVFEHKYQLLPLDELRTYISENRHLPGIPAAATVEKEGIEVGEMQRMMMAKIEELTLYVLQLEEKVNLLSKK